MIRYLSVCSGIEAASCAWHSLGWQPVAFSEIEPFPSAVLAHRFPNVPNWGDMTKFQEWPDATVDLLVGGTPCQSFSVAGLRKGLADPRGNLALVYLAIAARYRPAWVVWENVPGVLSDAGNAFGNFLAGLSELGYGWSYRVLDAQYVRVESHPRAVPQRRRRVFVVGHLGDWRRAAAVLFERESLCGNPAPRREAGERVAPTVEARANAGGAGWGTDFMCGGGLAEVERGGIDREDGHTLVPEVCGTLSDGAHMGGGSTARTPTRAGSSLLPEVAWCLQERDAKGADSDTKPGHLIPVVGGFDEAIPFDTTQITSVANRSVPRAGDPSHPLAAHAPVIAFAIQGAATRENPESGPDGVGVRADGCAYTLEARAEVQEIAFSCKDHGADAGEVSPTLRSMEFDATHANGGGQVAIAFGWQNSSQQGASASASVTPTLDKSKVPGLGVGMSVRRLTPRECERLQGFPDDYTLIQVRGKPAADGPRYRALGNSMAVNVMCWIGWRIAGAIQRREAA